MFNRTSMKNQRRCQFFFKFVDFFHKYPSFTWCADYVYTNTTQYKAQYCSTENYEDHMHIKARSIAASEFKDCLLKDVHTEVKFIRML